MDSPTPIKLWGPGGRSPRRVTPLLPTLREYRHATARSRSVGGVSALPGDVESKMELTPERVQLPATLAHELARIIASALVADRLTEPAGDLAACAGRAR